MLAHDEVITVDWKGIAMSTENLNIVFKKIIFKTFY
jgi:hypothetical protein